MKIYAYLALALFLAGAATTVGVYMHRCHNAQDELRSIAEQSKRELQDAKDQIVALNTQHGKDLAAQKVASDAQHKADVLQHSSDLERVRQLDAARAERTALASTAAGQGSGSACGVIQSETERRLSSLEQVAAGLADADRDALTAIGALAGERDSLNGR